MKLISYKIIGRNIRAVRKERGLTQEQTAELMKISVLHYGRLERGERPASLEQIAKVASVLGTSISLLLRDCAPGETFGMAPDNAALTLGQQATSIASGCSPEAQKLMIDLLRTVALNDRVDDI